LSIETISPTGSPPPARILQSTGDLPTSVSLLPKKNDYTCSVAQGASAFGALPAYVLPSLSIKANNTSTKNHYHLNPFPRCHIPQRPQKPHNHYLKHYHFYSTTSKPKWRRNFSTLNSHHQALAQAATANKHAYQTVVVYRNAVKTNHAWTRTATRSWTQAQATEDGVEARTTVATLLSLILADLPLVLIQQHLTDLLCMATLHLQEARDPQG